MNRWFCGSGLCLGLVVNSLAFSSAARADDVMGPASASPRAAGGGDPALGGLELTAPPDDSLAPAQEQTEEASTYYLGVRYRGLIIPKFALDWFMDGGQTVYVNGVGPEFAARSGSAEYRLSAWVSFYDMSPAAIKGHQNEEEAWEIIESDMKSLYLTADFLWHQPLTEGLDLSYGGGAGIGLIFGDLYRTQAFLPEGGSPGNAADYRPCQEVGVPSTTYCDDANAHYPSFSEASWGDGGAKPSLFPWLAAELGLRYQPHPQLATHLDLGVGLTGFMLGSGWTTGCERRHVPYPRSGRPPRALDAAEPSARAPHAGWLSSRPTLAHRALARPQGSQRRPQLCATPGRPEPTSATLPGSSPA